MLPPDPWVALAQALEALATILRESQRWGSEPPAAPVTPQPDIWVTARQFSQHHPAFPLNTVKNLVSAREANGLREAGIVREVLQKKLVIHEARFLRWLLREPDLPSLTLLPPHDTRRTRRG